MEDKKYFIKFNSNEFSITFEDVNSVKIDETHVYLKDKYSCIILMAKKEEILYMYEIFH